MTPDPNSTAGTVTGAAGGSEMARSVETSTPPLAAEARRPARDRSAAARETTEWLSARERGTVFGARVAIFVARRLGRPLARSLVSAIALYYTVVSGRVRKQLREYYARLRDERVGFWTIFRHVRTFAWVTLDRFLLTPDRAHLFEIKRFGNTHLIEQRDSGAGAILLGAHIGSYDAMRLSAIEENLDVLIAGFFENARMINRLLADINPTLSERVVHLQPGDLDTLLSIRDRVESGVLVAMAGDRTGLNDKTVSVDFLGAKASFPTGPWILAAALKCPVYLTFGIHHYPNRYDLHCTPFAERIVLPRGGREDALRAIVQRYAAALETRVRAAPDNWFNFFDFWAP